MVDPPTIALLGGAIALVTVCVNLLITILTMTRIEKVHQATNSMKDALVETTRILALATGREQGIKEERARRMREDDA